MKRLFTVIALLGFVGMLAGCEPANNTTPSTGGTNATPPAASTNATK